MKLVIGNKNYSSWSLRPWLLLKHFNVDFEEIRVPLYEKGSKGKLLSYSPAGKVPTLVDGSLTVWDSLAICEYLAEKFPDKPFWPRDKSAKALARSIVSEMHSGFFAIREELPMNCRHKEKVEASLPVQADVLRICQIWKDCRKKYADKGPFLFGEFSIADAFYAPVVLRFNSYGIDVGEVEKVYMTNMLVMPAMQKWVAEGIAETEVIPIF